MYLKSIEIQGFKSFAHKTVLNFNNGVTAIVGPNGSGKSNISDAVRWVLGEQKVKQLRGSAMQDVIFSGTEIRKPQGFAYVAITLDNSDKVLSVDYTEVTVSRRLYRSGESEYMINGQIVRLKDVQELFYDTGIGREGYSIIGQGQIDAILNGKPEDRRGLFDEAAGIVKFKRRKLTSLKKLENEKANLQRVTDIVDELEKRIKPLQKQSESAKHYLLLKDEQKNLDLNLFVREIDTILDAKQKAEDNLSIVNASLKDAEQENDELKDKGSELNDKVLELDEIIERKKNELGRANLLKQNLEGQINVRIAEIKAEETGLKTISEQMERIAADAKENEKHSSEYLSALSELESSLVIMLKDGNSGDSVDTDELKELVKRLGSFKELLLEHFPELSVAETADSLDDASTIAFNTLQSTDTEAAEEEDDDFSFAMPDWLKDIKNKRNDLELIKEKEDRTNAWLKQASDEYNLLTDELKKLQRIFAEKQKALADISARYDSLKNLVERYDGFGESIRAVMRERDRIGGIRGVVADLIKTDKEYETAIETALGGRIQNIVTDTERSAKESVAYLKKTRQGRATFLPLDAIRYKEQSEYRAALSERGVIGIASDLVQTDDEFRQLTGYLLASVLVVDNIDNALVIASKHRHSLRMVTLEGELLSPGGSISGGAYRNNSKLIGRSREIEELQAKKREAEEAFSSASEKIRDEEKLIADKNAEVDELKTSLRDIAVEKNELSLNILSDMKLRFSELKQKTEFISDNILRICEAADKADSDMSRANDNMRQCRERIEAANKDISERNADISDTEALVDELEKAIKSFVSEKDELAGSRTGFDERRAELADEVLRLQKEVIRLENIAQKEQDRLDDRSSYIWDEYELGPSAARAFYDESYGSLSSIRERLAEVRRDIKSLGPVNVQAIEEYKEVSSRYEFLSAQQQDLIKSEESIIAIIDELDREMKKQFSEQFALIREQFKIVFAELFGGGVSDLELICSDDDELLDELEAGINIIVQPPGKKLQNIMQLSGGEKALTAIALLFAIQNLKPSPFCLLDEIEAALDDSNVVRFSSYLHKLTNDTQFIVITHRRGTMEAADRLYGVTMQEKGVSKLVSVDLVSEELS
mgnify:CR=1 FL=1